MLMSQYNLCFSLVLPRSFLHGCRLCSFRVCTLFAGKQLDVCTVSGRFELKSMRNISYMNKFACHICVCECVRESEICRQGNKKEHIYGNVCCSVLTISD